MPSSAIDKVLAAFARVGHRACQHVDQPSELSSDVVVVTLSESSVPGAWWSPGTSRLLRRTLAGAEVVEAGSPRAARPLLTPWARRLPLIVHTEVGTAFTRVDRLVLRRASRIVVASHADKRALVQDAGLAPWKIKVDPSLLLRGEPPARTEWPGHRLVLSSTGLDGGLRLSVIVEAWNLTRPSRPSDSTLVLLVDEAHRNDPALLRGIDGVESHVLHDLDGPRLDALFAGADLHVSDEHRKDDAMTTALRAARAGTPTASPAHGPVARLMAELDAELVIDDADGDEPLLAGLALLDGGALPSPERTAAFAARVAERARVRRYDAVVTDG